MANIYCTVKLAAFLKPIITKDHSNEEQWNAHLFYVEGRKCIIFLNKETMYAFVLFDLLKKNITAINRLFIDGFINQLYADQIIDSKDELILRAQYGSLTFLPTNNDRSAIGSINDCIARITAPELSTKISITIVKSYTTDWLNDTPMGAVQYRFPTDLMRDRIKDICK